MTTILTERLSEVEARLAANSAPQANGYVLWIGYTQPNGYGYINIGDFHIAAHKAALIFSGVAVPAGMDTCHRCDVRNCVNPAHLYVGTRRQNMADCTARGRHNKPRGEAHWCAKLTAAEVGALRARRAKGETVVSLAASFGIHHATVSRIARRVWRTEVSL